MKLRDSERTIQRTARLWLYAGDHTQPHNVFDFTMSRARDGPREFLKGYRGYLQADAFGGYDGIYTSGDIVEVGCNAHARRKFHEAQTTDQVRAVVALAYYRELYAIEAEIRKEIAKLGDKATESERAATRLRIRQERAVPVLEKFRTWLETQRPDVVPKSPLGTAMGSGQNNWEALTRYASSGYLDIDDKVSEREMKNIATGRKNWLFTGSETGGRTAAVLFSMVSSCRRQGHDPFAYLRDVLTRLPGQPKERLADLLPDRWTPPETTDATTGTTGPDVAEPVM